MKKGVIITRRWYLKKSCRIKENLKKMNIKKKSTRNEK